MDEDIAMNIDTTDIDTSDVSEDNYSEDDYIDDVSENDYEDEVDDHTDEVESEIPEDISEEDAEDYFDNLEDEILEDNMKYEEDMDDASEDIAEDASYDDGSDIDTEDNEIPEDVIDDDFKNDEFDNTSTDTEDTVSDDQSKAADEPAGDIPFEKIRDTTAYTEDSVSDDQNEIANEADDTAYGETEGAKVDTDEAVSEDLGEEALLETQEDSENQHDYLRQMLEQNVRESSLPKDNGHWSDDSEPGNGYWIPDDNAEFTWKKNGKTHVTSGKEIKEKYNIEGVRYIENEADFEPFEDPLLGHVEVDEMPTKRDGKDGSYQQAINGITYRTGMSKKEILDYMQENNLTFHECGDRKTIRAIPTEINAAFKHTGGIGIQKNLNAVSGTLNKDYGNFSLSKEKMQGTINKAELDSAVNNMHKKFRDYKKNS